MAGRLLRVVCGGVRAIVGGDVLRTAASPAFLTRALQPLTGCEQKRGYAMRLELTEHGIVWRRPEYVPSWKPEKSGDLEPHKDPDETLPRLCTLPTKSVLDEVDDVTKQLLSLKFSSHKEFVKIKKYETMRRIQRHQYDTSSMEVKISMLTVKIRNLQQATFRCKKNTFERVRLLELIDRRKKLLKFLRHNDYKRFEWLIEELNILYRPPPRYYRWITRKASLKNLVRMHGMALKKKRLAEYQKTLELQKEPFLREKAETLQWIAETEASLGVPVTVPEDTRVTASQTSDTK
ncbi:28S ribosomal protein S15, mitochondrial-like [Homarus americanus]|nr:28S ribosomal protein S15, mitochondrial-like [Homarus americanus]